MNLILRDFLRRWWWVWALLLTFNLALLTPAGVLAGGVSLVLVFVPWLRDLNRGHARVLAVLPVTHRQIARAWWWAALGLPTLATLAILAVGLLACGMDSVWFSAPNRGTLITKNCLGNISILSLFSAGFMLLSPANPLADHWLVRLRRAAAGLWFVAANYLYLAFCSYLLNGRRLLNERDVWPALVALSLLGMIVSWFRAETLARERAGSRIQTPARRPCRPANRSGSGYGGMLFLIQIMLRQGLLLFTVMILVMFLTSFILLLQRHWLDHAPMASMKQFLLNPELGVFATMAFSMIIFMQFATLTASLRSLRTLPVSASRLAAALVFVPMFCVLPFELVVAFWLHPGMNANAGWSTALFLLAAALVGLVAPLLLMTGQGARMLMAIVPAITGVSLVAEPWVQKHLQKHLQNVSTDSLLVMVLLAVAAAFLSTRWMLSHSRRVYRTAATGRIF